MRNISIAFLLALTCTASATETLTTDCSWQSGGRFTCTEKYRGPRGVAPDARIIHTDTPVDEARDARWLDECVTGIMKDELGVGRYVYKARGCEYGILPSEQFRVLPAPSAR